jgi:uncharacterized membrane protein
MVAPLREPKHAAVTLFFLIIAVVAIDIYVPQVYIPLSQRDVPLKKTAASVTNVPIYFVR